VVRAFIPGTVAVSGSVSPGSTVNTIGTLSVNSTVTWNGGASFASASTDWKYDLASGSSNADLLNITGNFTKGSGSHFRFDFGGTGESGRTYKLVDWTGSSTFNADHFSYANLPADMAAEFQINGTQLDLVLISCTSPTITLGANPSVCKGVTSASLTYSAFTGGPTTYTIDYSDAANAAGFLDVTTPVALNAAPSSIPLTVPACARQRRAFTAPHYIINNGPCRGSTSFSVTVTDVPAMPGGISQSNPSGSTVCKTSTGVIYLDRRGVRRQLVHMDRAERGNHHERAGYRANRGGLECRGRWRHGYRGDRRECLRRQRDAVHHVYADQWQPLEFRQR
jgi:hypothetical protein